MFATYDHAQPDPLSESTAEIIQHLNADHKDALILLARVLAGMVSQEDSTTRSPGSIIGQVCWRKLKVAPFTVSFPVSVLTMA